MLTLSLGRCANYKAPCCVNVPQGTRLPVIDEVTTCKFLSQRKTAAGKDGLSHWREFAEELAPIVTPIFKLSIKSQTVPCYWKLVNISPVPSETLLLSLNHLRLISVNDIIVRLEVKPVIGSYLLPDQFVRNLCCQ